MESVTECPNCETPLNGRECNSCGLARNDIDTVQCRSCGETVPEARASRHVEKGAMSGSWDDYYTCSEC